MAPAEPILCAWRATGPYLPTAASKNGLIAETRLFLQAYGASHSIQQARDELINSRLLQRSRTTRAVIARNILARLTRWNPPAWVLDDLVLASQQEDLSRLRSLLLLHHARQETLLYEAILPPFAASIPQREYRNLEVRDERPILCGLLGAAGSSTAQPA